MKTPFIDKYSTAPATRRTLNKLLAENALLRIKDLTMPDLTVPAPVAHNYYHEVRDFTQRGVFQKHQEGQSDLAAHSMLTASRTTMLANIGALVAAINILSIPLGFGEITADGYGDGDEVAALPAQSAVAGPNNLLSAHSANTYFAAARNSLSTVIMVFNRVADRLGYRRIVDHGTGVGSAALELYDLADVIVAPVDITGDFVNFDIANAEFVALANNSIYVASQIVQLAAFITSEMPADAPAVPNISATGAIVGTAALGNTLTFDIAGVTATGSPAPVITLLWLLDGQPTENRGTSYELTLNEVGKKLSMEVTATNASGSDTMVSAETAEVAAKTPTNTTAPVLSGDNTTGGLATLSNGVWDTFGAEPEEYEFRWNLGGSLVDGETGTTLSIPNDASGKDLKGQVRCKAGNSDWSGWVDSNTVTIQSAPTIETAPVIEFGDDGAVGDTVTMTDEPEIAGLPVPTITYMWSVGGVDQGAYGAIAPYTITAEDAGLSVVLKFRAVNSHGSIDGQSDPLEIPAE